MSNVPNTTIQVTPEQLKEALAAFTTSLLPEINNAVRKALAEIAEGGHDAWDTSFVPVSLTSIVGAWIDQNLKDPTDRERMFDHLVLSMANQIGVSLVDEDGDDVPLPQPAILLPH